MSLLLATNHISGGKNFDPLTLLAALVCVTSLIFATNDMYGFISWRRREILMDL